MFKHKTEPLPSSLCFRQISTSPYYPAPFHYMILHPTLINCLHPLLPLIIMCLPTLMRTLANSSLLQFVVSLSTASSVPNGATKCLKHASPQSRIGTPQHLSQASLLPHTNSGVCFCIELNIHKIPYLPSLIFPVYTRYQN